MTREEILGIFFDASEQEVSAMLALHEAKLRQLQEQEQERKAQQTHREQLVQRFDAAVGEREFVHPMVREGILQTFLQQADQVEGDVDDTQVLAALTDGKECFRQQRQLEMADIGPVSVRDMDRLTDAEYYAAIPGRV